MPMQTRTSQRTAASGNGFSKRIVGHGCERPRRDDYRQLFSTIFSDYYLFDDLAYGAMSAEAAPRPARLHQNPDFRRVFYEDLLPEMKQQGRTLIVVSHDDRYFDAAASG